MDDVMQHIADLIRRGRKIEAIKVLREATGVGLKEAKEAVDRLSAEMEGQAPIPMPDAPGAPEGQEGVIALIRRKRKIDAIKLMREQTGMGLKEAKEAVERLTEKIELVDADRAAGRETISPVHEELVELLAQGKKMEALKLFKDQAVLGFKESREEEGTSKGCLWITVFLGLLLFLYIAAQVFF
jgi:ribosomal protein L7/L12